MKRTHTCGQLTEQDIDKEVQLCGWVFRRRDHGKLIFIDIRDRYGLTQIVFHPKDNAEAHKVAQELRSEFVIMVRGKVGKRPKGTENPKLATGMVEIAANYLEILNPSEALPFEIDDTTTEVSEETRLPYRYLDLRRPQLQNNLILRHKLCKVIRDFLDAEGFVEVETPILTKSTPEGARDYLVPSRLNPGFFYALPQSPQLFKQILMVSGMDKYFQIAKCFRDEDLRADRQPEFTQLDLEMSFVDDEDIFLIMEKLFQKIFKQTINVDIKIPFPRISHKEAKEKYNTDKPHLNKDEKYSLCWVVDFPLFNFNQEEKRWESEHHPFTSPKEEDLHLLNTKDLDKIRARSYDLVLNGTEIASGSIRIHKNDVQQKIFDIIGLSKEEAEERFGFLLRAFKFGAPPHGGIAFGLDRLMSILVGSESIREVIAFPKTQKAFCPLTEAPSPVKKEQLKELGISITKKEVKNV
ncbi:MAG: aspartate--tRNA ligase [Candidatus Omnitrophica bacterium]|nr:aspartate--tRNA ligase [Candidatus Omnitrophota bacterium]